VLVLTWYYLPSSRCTAGPAVRSRVTAVARATGWRIEVLSYHLEPYLERACEEGDGGRLSEDSPDLQVRTGGTVRVWRLRLPYIRGITRFFAEQRCLRDAMHWLSRHAFHPELVECHWLHPFGEPAVRIARRHGVPTVGVVRGDDVNVHARSPLMGVGVRRALRAMDAVVCLSEELARRVRSIAPRCRPVVIPNGVDTQLFRPEPQSVARERLSLPERRRVVLFVGALAPEKRVDVLLQALALLPDEVHAVIVGGPRPSGVNSERYIRRLVEDLGISSRCVLVGPQPREELRWWYSAADVLVLPSAREGSANVLLESLACGTPVVATPAGEAPELLANRELGVLCEGFSTRAVAEAIGTALRRSWDRDGIRRWVLRHRTWEHVAAAHKEVYDRLLK